MKNTKQLPNPNSQIGLLRSAPSGEVSVLNNPGTGYDSLGASVLRSYSGGQGVELKPGTADSAYIAFFPPSSRE